MKALLCKAHGLPDTLVIEDVPDPTPGPGQVVLDVHAAGVNYPDFLIIQNLYQFKPELPFAPGSEVSGVVSALGEGVGNVVVGDRVVALCGNGGMAEKVVVQAAGLMSVPDGVAMTTAAGFVMTYGTSYHALVQRGALQPGETLLVLGAGGGVGITAVELGKVLGARVIAAASSEEKLQAARDAGADEVINYSDGALKDKVKALTGGQGADVIYDPVGGDMFHQSMRCINWKGRLLVIGFAAGADQIPQLPVNLVLLKGCQVVGVFWGAFAGREADVNAQNFAVMYDWLQQGKIKPLVSQVFPFAQAADAIAHLGSRRAIGKVVVDVKGG